MQWELDRELGSGKEPFLKSAECRKALAAGGKSQKGSASGIVELGKASGKAMPFEEPHNFLVDWAQPREELMNQFGDWLDTQEKSGRLLRKPALGKPRQPLTMLRKMSIVRLKANGYSLRSATAQFTDKKRFVESLHKINWTMASREFFFLTHCSYPYHFSVLFITHCMRNYKPSQTRLGLRLFHNYQFTPQAEN